MDHIFETLSLIYLSLSPFIFIKSQKNIHKFSTSIFFLVLFFLRYLLNPFINRFLNLFFLFLILIFSFFIFSHTKKLERIFSNIIGKSYLFYPLQIIVTVIIILGLSEFIFFWLLHFDRIKLYSPIYELKVSDDIEDISLINERFKNLDKKFLTNDFDLLIKVTDNSHLIFHPIFFWEPKKGEFPYNKFGLKGELNKIKKEKHEIRIFFLGDSNTEGEDLHSYPYLLQKKFEKNKRDNIKVINAGVTGYTSFQGLLRFKHYILKFSPDILFLSFGWNDPSTFFYGYDKSRKIPLILLNFYDIFKNYASVKFFVSQKIKLSTKKGIDDLERVSPEDYRKNILEFIKICKKTRIKIILLTRPSRIKFLKNGKDFRKNVPIYNDILRDISKNENIPLIDLENVFNRIEDKESYFIDDCHNNFKGYELISEILYDSLQNYLK